MMDSSDQSMITWRIEVVLSNATSMALTSRASNPDDAIYAAKLRGHFKPHQGDRVVRCRVVPTTNNESDSD